MATYLHYVRYLWVAIRHHLGHHAVASIEPNEECSRQWPPRIDHEQPLVCYQPPLNRLCEASHAA
jgi:hypothetical protein